MSSVTKADLAAYKDYAEKNAEDILSKLNFGYMLGALITSHADVLGRINLTEFTFDSMSKRYSEDFTPTQNVIGMKTRHLDVKDIKIDLKFNPKIYERNYRAYLQKTGMKPSEFPLLAFIIPKLIQKNNEERALAAWRGEAALVEANTDLLIQCVDGFHKHITDEFANVSNTVTGAITKTNAVASLEAVYEGIGAAYQSQPLDIFMSKKGGIRLLQNYRDAYGKYTRDEHGNPQLDIGTGMDRFHFDPAMKENAILITPASNMHQAYANGSDTEGFEMEDEDRNLKMWMDYKIDYNFGMLGDIISVNDMHDE